MDSDGTGYEKADSSPCLEDCLSGQHVIGIKQCEAGAIPRPSLPSPRFGVRSVQDRIWFVGLRTTEAAGISGHIPSGLWMEVSLVK